MPDVKFFAVLPTNASTSDRVTRLSISGNLLQDPQQWVLWYFAIKFREL